MLFANKTTLNSLNRSKTPLKTPAMQATVARMGKKQLSRGDLHQKQVRSRSKQNQQTNYRMKQSYVILQYLQDIYNELHFNQFEIFPLQKIEKAKKNIQNLVGFLGEKPVCRYHQDLLNLYCEHDKSALCVSCIYKVNEHKGHKIKSIQSVQKTLDLQTIRNEQKTKALIDQLQQLQDQINSMIKDLSQNFSVISKYTFSLIDESIKQLTLMRVEMEKKLSLAYRRTSTVIDRYKQSLELVVNHLEDSVQKTTVMNSLSKYMLFKELTYENELIGELVAKFNENKQLIDQWRKSNRQFQKIVLKKRNNINERMDSIVVTEF